jgi:hypothetical protein
VESLGDVTRLFQVYKVICWHHCLSRRLTMQAVAQQANAKAKQDQKRTKHSA